MAGVYAPAMIRYVTGDATDPQGEGNKIIAHVCNDEGAWGKGFVVGLGRRYPLAEKNYRSWASWKRWDGMPFERGQVQFVTAACGSLLEPDFIFVANMVAQEGYRKRYEDPPERYLDYFSLGLCLEKLALFAEEHDASVAMPRIGCGLAGGSWDVVGEMIERYLCERGIPVTVYDLA